MYEKKGWIPPDLGKLCSPQATVTTCQPQAYVFLTLVTQLFGYSPVKDIPPENVIVQEFPNIRKVDDEATVNLYDEWKEKNSSDHAEIESFEQIFNGNEEDATTGFLPEQYDFIVLGAESAGCVDANRLSEIKEWRIVEANSQYHGMKGYLSVERFPYVDQNVPILMEVLREIGYEELDVNAGRQIGMMNLQATSLDGIRHSAIRAFIRPIREKRKNLKIVTEAQVTRITIDPRTRKATGVEYVVQRAGEGKEDDFVTRTASTRKEVILSAGAINSPKILMLSGIGPAKDLETLEILS